MTASGHLLASARQQITATTLKQTRDLWRDGPLADTTLGLSNAVEEPADRRHSVMGHFQLDVAMQPFGRETRGPPCSKFESGYHRDGARLTAKVNSEARADRIRKTIERAFGKGVCYRASELQSTESMLADVRAAGNAGADPDEHERLNDSPEVREKISAMMAAHWEHWVDRPIPILGNRTPMEAIKDPDGREIVESIIMQAERTADAATPQTDAEVFQRLRQRLGLPRSRNSSTSGAD